MLPEKIATDPRVRDLVDDVSLWPSEAVQAIRALGVQTSESSVRRARKARGLAASRSAYPEGAERVKPAPVRRRDRSVPTWRASIEYDEAGGVLSTVPRPVSDATAEVTPDEVEVFAEFGLSSEDWKITSLRRSKWQQREGGGWLEAFRATFARRSRVAGRVSEEEAARWLSAYPAGAQKVSSAGGVLLAPVGDTQLGKPDGGGTASTVERFGRVVASVAERVREDRPSHLVLPWLGDCLEGHVAQSGRNVARLDVSITEQVRIYRRLMFHQVATLAALVDHVLIPVVPGNHDETLRAQTMPPADSWALEGASAVADVLAQDPERFGHVQFLFPPEEELGVTVNVGTEEHPYTIHCTHGHVARGPDKMVDWWKGQTHGRQQAGASDLLLTAHWHHLRVEQTGGGRVWIQIPAMDGGSDWFRRKTGDDAQSGVVSMELVGGPVGFRDLRFHS